MPENVFILKSRVPQTPMGLLPLWPNEAQLKAIPVLCSGFCAFFFKCSIKSRFSVIRRSETSSSAERTVVCVAFETNFLSYSCCHKKQLIASAKIHRPLVPHPSDTYTCALETANSKMLPSSALAC